MYAAWIKINDALPWIELEGTFQTKVEARKAAKEIIGNVRTTIVNISEKNPRKH